MRQGSAAVQGGVPNAVPDAVKAASEAAQSAAESLQHMARQAQQSIEPQLRDAVGRASAQGATLKVGTDSLVARNNSNNMHWQLHIVIAAAGCSRPRRHPEGEDSRCGLVRKVKAPCI